MVIYFYIIFRIIIELMILVIVRKININKNASTRNNMKFKIIKKTIAIQNRTSMMRLIRIIHKKIKIEEKLNKGCKKVVHKKEGIRGLR